MKKKCHKCREEEVKKRPPPSRPLRRCSSQGCAELVAADQRFCPRHVPIVPAGSRAEYHKANNYFYSSARWRGFRKWYLRRSPLCVAANCTAPATDVDHIKAIADGGAKFDAKNCQSLCHSCHSIKTQSEQTAGRSAGAPGEGGAKTYSSNRVLPLVKLKKTVRRFWARGVSDQSQIDDIGGDLNQTAQKATVMMGGSVSRGERGELI